MSNRTSKSIQIPLPIDGEVFHIQLTKGYVAIVDAIDADLSEFKWSAQETDRQSAYAHRRPNKSKIFLHRIIMERVLSRVLLADEQVDHWDNNPLNCRRDNLRLTNQLGNNRNHRRRVDNKSGFKGVYFSKDHQKWAAEIRVGGKKIYLGRYSNPEEAHAAYCKAALEHFGEYARFD